MSPPARLLEVAPERLERWLRGFAERHEGVTAEWDGGLLVAAAGGDGARARFEHFRHDPLAIVLVRRGGYAVGLAVGDRLTGHKVGTRYVQSRTAAGGWSQQRFARRRDNQAHGLVQAVVEHAGRIVCGGDGPVRTGAPGIPRGLVVGGDRSLVGQVLAVASLRALAELPRRELFDLPDPRRAVLLDALRRGRAVRVTLTEP